MKMLSLIKMCEKLPKLPFSYERPAAPSNVTCTDRETTPPPPPQIASSGQPSQALSLRCGLGRWVQGFGFRVDTGEGLVRAARVYSISSLRLHHRHSIGTAGIVVFTVWSLSLP